MRADKIASAAQRDGHDKVAQGAKPVTFPGVKGPAKLSRSRIPAAETTANIEKYGTVRGEGDRYTNKAPTASEGGQNSGGKAGEKTTELTALVTTSVNTALTTAFTVLPKRISVISTGTGAAQGPDIVPL